MHGQFDIRIDTFSSTVAPMLSVPLALLYLPLSGSLRCEFCARFVLRTTRDHRYVICRRICRNSSSPSRSAVISAIHNDSPAMRSASRDKIAHLTRLHLIDSRGEARGERRRWLPRMAQCETARVQLSRKRIRNVHATGAFFPAIYVQP